MATPGEYIKSFISNVPADLSSQEALFFRKTIPRFPEEAVYIYSLKEKRLIYADGWEDILGYKDDEISMQTIINTTTPEFAPFANELNEKALKFIMTRKNDLEKYSFTIELKKLHKDGKQIPLITKVGVFNIEKGVVTSIIGRSQINNSIILGNIMRYAAFGPEKSTFEEVLNKQLFKYYAISRKEKEALEMAAKGYSFRQIAENLNVSLSAVEKRIIPMYKRFNVKGISHLISFAYDNHILK